MTVGFLAVAVSSGVLLAAGARLLSEPAFGGLGWTWTFSTVFGFGIATPTEQAISQRLNRGASIRLGRPASALVASSVLGAVAVAVGTGHSHVADGFSPLLLSSVTALAGWIFAALVRGRVAGAGDMTAYGLLLALEATVRLGLVGSAWMLDPAPMLLGLAVGLPTLLSATAGLALVRRRQRPRAQRPAHDEEHTSSLVAFMVVAVAYQACLNGPSVVLGWSSSQFSAATLGAFVVASAWLRTPTILIGGLSVQALTELTRAWGSADRRQLADVARPLFTAAGCVAFAATAVCTAASPLAFQLLYGEPTQLPPVLLVSLALSTVIVIGAVMTGTALLATDGGRWAAIAWCVGGSTTMIGALTSGGHSTLLAAALLLGPGLTLALGVAFLRRRLTFGPNHPNG